MDKDSRREGVARSAYSPGEGVAQERWSIDPNSSRLTFSLRHLVVHRIDGEFIRWGGTLSINRDDPALSVVELWIDLASISTGDAERDAHVCSAEFLDVEHFPRAIFRSQRVQLRDGQVSVDGRLELHGLSRDIRVEVELTPTETAANGQVCTSYKARAAVNRQAFGLHWNQDLDVGGVVVANAPGRHIHRHANAVDLRTRNHPDDEHRYFPPRRAQQIIQVTASSSRIYGATSTTRRPQ